MTALAKVLLVDDERELVVVLTQRLTKRNYSVTFAPSGKDALAQLAGDKDIEVVLLDAKMSGLDWIETLKINGIRLILSESGLSVIIRTDLLII